MSEWVKDPNETVSYTWDWTADLNGSTIASVAWVVPTGITNSAVSNTTTTATILLAGGTVGRAYPITCRVTLANNEILDFTKTIVVREA